MAKFFYDEISQGLPPSPARISSVKIWETDTSTATYRP
jgi:hypothetical protein